MSVLLPLLIRWFFYLDRMDKKYVVYQHVTPDGMYYFGQTQNVERRWRNNGAEYKRTALQPYIEKFGWENIQHIVLFRDQTRENALWIEDFLIETAREDGVCINKQRSGLVSKEEGYNKNQMKYLREQNHENEVRKQKQYYEQNKDQIKQYYQKNRDEILEQQREYYQKNREKLLEQQREYREKNREKYNEYHREQQREYYQKNREKLLEQQREYREKNREKYNEYYREYQRQYRKRKKLEQQLKEVQTTLF